MLEKTKKVLGISVLVLFLMSMMVVVVSAQQGQQQQYKKQDEGKKKCGWACEYPEFDYQFYKNCKKVLVCESGDYCYDSYGKQYWKCDKYHQEWTCDTGTTGTWCKNWIWKCCSDSQWDSGSQLSATAQNNASE